MKSSKKSKINRNTATKESREFWDFVDKVVEDKNIRRIFNKLDKQIKKAVEKYGK